LCCGYIDYQINPFHHRRHLRSGVRRPCPYLSTQESFSPSYSTQNDPCLPSVWIPT
jgi:hypothetical protein